MRNSPADATTSQPNPRPPGEGASAIPIDDDTDFFVGWHVSSFELRRGLTVIDLDDAALRELFAV